jgi:catechol 2,3-dioxygenase-like lactoylglutathione lyase family enzyme
VTATGLHHVGVTVSDLDRALGFYRDLLGLTVRERVEESGGAVAEVTGLPGAHVRIADLELGDGRVIELVEYVAPEGRPLSQRTCDPGACHLAVEVINVDAVAGRLRAAGMVLRSEPVTLADAGPHWSGVRLVYAVDPDGVTVELVQRATR